MRVAMSDLLSRLSAVRGPSGTVQRVVRIEEPRPTVMNDNHMDKSEMKDGLKRDLIAISYSPAYPSISVKDLSQAVDDCLIDVATECSVSGAQLLLQHPTTSAILVAAVAACYEISQVIEVRIYECHVSTELESHHVLPTSIDAARIESAILSSLHAKIRTLLDMDTTIDKFFVASFGKVVDNVVQYAIGVTCNNFLLITLDSTLIPMIASELRDSITHLLIQVSRDCGLNKIKALVAGPCAGLADILEQCGFIQTTHFLSLSIAPFSSCLDQEDGMHEFASLRVTDIYLLAGQSNMSGRGSLEEYGSMETERYLASLHGETKDREREWRKADGRDGSLLERIYSYDPLDGWVRNRTNIHQNVDVLKTTGIGPGIGFAEEMLSSETSCLKDGTRTPGWRRDCIGLIPSAVGGTALSEWLPHSALLSDSCSSENSLRPMPATLACHGAGAISFPANSSYHRGCPNLLSCALRSVFLAIRSIHSYAIRRMNNDEEIRQYVESQVQLNLSHGSIGGVLWYQGCNDAAESLDAASSLYAKRFQFLTYYLRQACRFIARHSLFSTVLEARGALPPVPLYSSCDCYDIPVVAVAITSTRYWQLKHIRELRHFFLELVSSNVRALAVVDALGAPLLPDCIHISTQAAIALGRLIARSMIDLKDQKGVHAVRCFPIACLGPLTPEAVSAIYRAAAQEAVEELSASKAFLRPCSFVPSLVKSNATEVIDEVELVRSCDSASLFPVMKAPLKAVNFVYGETSALGMLHVLNTYVPRLLLDVDVAPHTKGLERDLCFVDLGCGNGTCIAAALLSGLFKRIVGVEIMRAKANECRAMSGKLLRSFDRIYSPADTPAPRVEVVEGNFQSYNWWEVADVVYMVTTCFTEDVVEELADRCRQGLRPGALAIFVDKAPLSRDCVPNHAPVMTVSSVSALVMAACDHPTFRLAGNMQARTSWGDACIFVYQKL